MTRLWILSTLGLLLATGDAGAADLPRGVKNGMRVERFTMHSQQGIAWTVEGIHGAKKDVLVESFGVSNPKIVSALRDRLRRKVSVRANADPENIRKDASASLVRAGAVFRPWGGNAIKKGQYKIKLNPRKLHAKAMHFDDTSALSTASFMWDAVSIDGTAIVSGEPAAAARAISERAHAGDEEGLKRAADDAQKHGVLLNDASTGIDHLTQGMRDIIKSAHGELVVGMKAVESAEFSKWLSKAAARGVKVTLVTRPEKMSAKAQAALSPDIKILNDPYGVLHGNFIVADREIGLFGSAHATKRALGQGSRRQSYELGYVVDDPEVVMQIHDALLAFEEHQHVTPEEARRL